MFVDNVTTHGSTRNVLDSHERTRTPHETRNVCRFLFLGIVEERYGNRTELNLVVSDTELSVSVESPRVPVFERKARVQFSS